MDSRWVWHSMIYTFIQELNLKESEVYEMNYISGLNWLSFFKNKNQVEANQRKNN